MDPNATTPNRQPPADKTQLGRVGCVQTRRAAARRHVSRPAGLVVPAPAGGRHGRHQLGRPAPGRALRRSHPPSRPLVRSCHPPHQALQAHAAAGVCPAPCSCCHSATGPCRALFHPLPKRHPPLTIRCRHRDQSSVDLNGRYVLVRTLILVPHPLASQLPVASPRVVVVVAAHKSIDCLGESECVPKSTDPVRIEVRMFVRPNRAPRFQCVQAAADGWTWPSPPPLPDGRGVDPAPAAVRVTGAPRCSSRRRTPSRCGQRPAPVPAHVPVDSFFCVAIFRLPASAGLVSSPLAPSPYLHRSRPPAVLAPPPLPPPLACGCRRRYCGRRPPRRRRARHRRAVFPAAASRVRALIPPVPLLSAHPSLQQRPVHPPRLTPVARHHVGPL